METYQALRALVGYWGTLYFGILFAAALTYALWPSNRETFDEAAQMPLLED